MSEVIEVRHVSKSYKIYKDKGFSLKDRILSLKRNRYHKKLVLNDINFTVKKGESIGLIGKNGCGKSTLLKLLSRIIYPDKGSIEIKGRVVSLIELGAGFHPDMSGLENIYINASIFGLTKKEINGKLNDIVKFSGLKDFIYEPVRVYSSGMYMRLAFAVAINVDADILLIDEILAVGDINFQEKCLKKLEQIEKNGTTVILVSHSLEQIEKFCNRSIWIRDGHIELDGAPKYVNNEYLKFMNNNKE